MYLAAAFLLGLAGSAHCFGMCGPLALIARRRPLAHHAGRVCVYLMLGAIAGSGGAAVAHAGSRNWLALGAGAAFLVSAAATLGRFRLPAMRRLDRAVGGALIRARALVARCRIGGTFLFGIVNGLLPCGLLYTAIAGSAASGDTVTAVLFMAAFAAGTLPMFTVLSFSAGAVSPRLPRVLRQAAPLATALVGALLLARGLEPGSLHAHAHVHQP